MDRWRYIGEDFKAELILAGAILLFCGIIIVSAKGISYLEEIIGNNSKETSILDNKGSIADYMGKKNIPQAIPDKYTVMENTNKEKTKSAYETSIKNKPEKVSDNKKMKKKSDIRKEQSSDTRKEEINLDSTQDNRENISSKQQKNESTDKITLESDEKTDISGRDADIVIKEHVKGIIRDNKLNLYESNGKIIVSNRGVKDRIWDISLKLKKDETTTLTNNIIHINELKPGEKKVTEYKFTTTDIPVLIAENLDVSSDIKGLQKYLIYNVELPFQIRIEIMNVKDFLMSGRFEKNIPEEATSVQVEASDGDIIFDPANYKVIWEGNLPVSKAIYITITGKIKIESTEKINLKSGKLYLKGKGAFSSVDIESSEAISSNRFGLEKKQSQDSINTWLITIFFKNLSEFDCKLNQVNLYNKDMATETLVETITPNKILSSGDVWKKTIKYYSETMPTFGHSVSFTMLPHYTRYSEGEFDIINEATAVARLKMEKSYDKNVLKIGQKGKIGVSLAIDNIGTAPVNSLYISDELPPNFKPIKISITYQGKDRNYELMTNGAKYYVENRKIIFEIKNITEILGNQLEPDETIKISYMLYSEKVEPGVYLLKAEGYGNTDPVGYKIPIESGEMPVIRATRGIVGLFLSKDILSTENDDEIKIVLYMKNSGRTTIRNLVLRDIIPEGFSIKQSDGQYEIIEEKGDATVIEWQVDKLSANEDAEISYILKGDGVYRARDVVAMVRG